MFDDIGMTFIDDLNLVFRQLFIWNICKKKDKGWKKGQNIFEYRQHKLSDNIKYLYTM